MVRLKVRLLLRPTFLTDKVCINKEFLMRILAVVWKLPITVYETIRAQHDRSDHLIKLISPQIPRHLYFLAVLHFAIQAPLWCRLEILHRETHCCCVESAAGWFGAAYGFATGWGASAASAVLMWPAISAEINKYQGVNNSCPISKILHER